MDASGPQAPGAGRIAELDRLIAELTALRADIVADAARSRRPLEHVDPANRESAGNLLCYLALRRHDLRPLQRRLAALGLSSLGRAEAHVMATLDAVLGALHDLARRPAYAPPEAAMDFARGRELLEAHTHALLGTPGRKRDVRIMVTLPPEAATDGELVRELVRRGMDCARINCAHDDAAAWSSMIENLRRAEQALGRSCRIAMDLAGPRLRTGALEPGPKVLRIRPRRDRLGRVVVPARIWLGPAAGAPPAAASFDLPAAFRARLREGVELEFTDAREAHRRWTIVEATERGCWAEARKTAYVVPETVFRCVVDGARCDTTAGDLPAIEDAIVLRAGDRLILTGGHRPGRPATTGDGGTVVAPATIGCVPPEALADLRAGESIWFDDGRIGGIVERAGPEEAAVRITFTRSAREKLRAGRGINLPDTRLHLPALAPRDLEDLRFAVQHADIVSLSFASSAEDVAALHEQMQALDGRRPAVVLKIESRRGFENLPAMLLTALRSPTCGVMIARGDLAVECGFERLAEVQEEILWICEAAHVPVIWATQVLESLAKAGMPSRAEITDAAMGHRAECVMLNKGPHLAEAVRVLDDILRRMETHQAKKQAMMRDLKLARLAGDLAAAN